MSLAINEIAIILLMQTTPAPAEYIYQEFNPSYAKQIEFSLNSASGITLATSSIPPVPKPEPSPAPEPKKLPKPDDGGTDPTPDDDDDTDDDRDRDSDDDSGPGDTDAGSQPSFGRF
ncbi:MAG: hypothetical protein NVV73_23030 [Cellvibrionaceae bacterium]|nr:hypothetical protein [Cellvibrionaceae bacterium]